MINSERFFTTPKTILCCNKEISERSRKVFVLTPKFTGMPQKEISKILENWFGPLNLYKPRQPKNCNHIYRDLIAIKNSRQYI